MGSHVIFETEALRTSTAYRVLEGIGDSFWKMIKWSRRVHPT